VSSPKGNWPCPNLRHDRRENGTVQTFLTVVGNASTLKTWVHLRPSVRCVRLRIFGTCTAWRIHHAPPSSDVGVSALAGWRAVQKLRESAKVFFDLLLSEDRIG